MSIKIKIVKERLRGTPILGKSWKLISVVRQRITLRHENARKEIENRERKISGMRRVEAQIIRGV